MRARSMFVVMALAATAAADGTTLQGKMVTAETAARSAHESRDPAAYEVCGQAYLEVANAARTEMPDLVPEAMYNAGVCFEAAGSIGAAIKLYTQLGVEARTSPLAQHALARRGHLYWRIGSFAKAAEDFETYAAKYAAEKDASDALENAFRLRAALGDDDAARADAEMWIKQFGGKKVRDAASASMRLAWMTRERAKPDAAMREYREWIKRYGGRADRDQVATAYVALGEIAWDASCKVKGTRPGGLCVEPARPSSEPRCSARPRVVAVARDPALVREATAAFKAAIRIAESSGDAHAGVIADHARLRLADQRIETFVALEMKDTKRWFEAWQKAMNEATFALTDLAVSKNPRSQLLASGRQAWLSQHAIDTLFGAPRPPGAKVASEELDAHCESLANVARGLEPTTAGLARDCLFKAERSNLVEEVALCVAVHDRHYPAAASGGERLPAAAWPRVRDVEPEIRYQPPGTVTPSPP